MMLPGVRPATVCGRSMEEVTRSFDGQNPGQIESILEPLSASFHISLLYTKSIRPLLTLTSWLPDYRKRRFKLRSHCFSRVFRSKYA